MKGPDRAAARERYRRLAPSYDRLARMTTGLRRTAVARLSLAPSDVVVDVGCGTGLSLPILRHAVGSEGRVIGIELSPEMARKARQRVDEHGWTNVVVVESAAEEAEVPVVNGALFFLTHDIMRSPPALQRILASITPGGRVVAVGMKWAKPRLNPLNLGVWWIARRYVTTLEGLDRPWTNLAALAPALTVQSIRLDTMYLAFGKIGEGLEIH